MLELTLSELLNGGSIAAHAVLTDRPQFFGRNKSGRVAPEGRDNVTGEIVPCELAVCKDRHVIGDWAYRPGPRLPWRTAGSRGEALRALDALNPRGHRDPRRCQGAHGRKAVGKHRPSRGRRHGLKA